MPLQRSPAGARPIGGAHATPREGGEDRAFTAQGTSTSALPFPIMAGTNAKASDVRFVPALKALAYEADIRGIDAIDPMAVNHVVPRHGQDSPMAPIKRHTAITARTVRVVAMPAIRSLKFSLS